MLHSAILSTFIKLQFVVKIFVLSIFERLLKTGFTVPTIQVILSVIFYDVLSLRLAFTALVSFMA